MDRKFFSFTLFCFLAGSVSGITPAEVEKLPFPRREERKIYWNDFDGPDISRIHMRTTYSFAEGAGVNGSKALCLERDNPEVYHLVTLELPRLEDGWYKVTFEARGESVRNVSGNPHDPGIVCVEYTDPEDNRYLGGRYARETAPGNTWRKYSYSFQAFKNRNTGIVLYLRKGWTGKVYFDNVAVVPVETPLSAVMNWPAHLAVHGKKSGFVFKIDPAAPRNCKVLLETANGGKRAGQLLAMDKNGFIKGMFPELVPGALEVRLTLFDENAGKKFHVQSYRLNVFPEGPVPGNAARLDRSGRLHVGNKPFMPLGVYTYQITTEDMKRIAAAGFNCVLDYQSLYLKSQPPADNPVDSIRRVCDKLAEHHLKIIFSLKDQLPGHDAREALNGTAGRDNVVRRIVSVLKDHPALLGWYISDEEPRENVPDVLRLREIVSGIDPWHPTWSLTCFYHTLPYYAITGDVVGIDLYPIAHDKPHSPIEPIVDAMRRGNIAGLPVWAVPQIFNWGTYAHRNDPAAFRKGRAPTGDEMTAMALLYAVCGAKGFVFYSDFDLYHRAEKLAPGRRDTEWSKVCRMVEVLKKIEPYLMSGHPAERIRIESRIHAQARGFADEQGKYCAVIAATDRNAKLTFTVPGKHLVSLFGRTRDLGNSRYEFNAPEIASDVLFEK